MIDPPTPTAAIPPESVVESAITASKNSPCRSKRGAVIFRGEQVLGRGCNQKPPGFGCDGSAACKATCRVEAVHAEQAAILGPDCMDMWNADILHVKTIDGQLVPSGGPSCVECSKLIVGAGIAGVWLYHEAGWRRYDAHEFHRLSLDHNRSARAESERSRAQLREALTVLLCDHSHRTLGGGVIVCELCGLRRNFNEETQRRAELRVGKEALRTADAPPAPPAPRRCRALLASESTGGTVRECGAIIENGRCRNDHCEADAPPATTEDARYTLEDIDALVRPYGLRVWRQVSTDTLHLAPKAQGGDPMTASGPLLRERLELAIQQLTVYGSMAYPCVTCGRTSVALGVNDHVWLLWEAAALLDAEARAQEIEKENFKLRRILGRILQQIQFDPLTRTYRVPEVTWFAQPYTFKNPSDWLKAELAALAQPSSSPVSDPDPSR